MARSGMANLIAELRGLTDAGTADYSIAGITYWTDDQLQTILDRRRLEVVEDALVPVYEYDAGTVIVTRYYAHHGNFEQTTGGTAVFVVKDSTFNNVGTASYTVDYNRGEVIFSTDTGGSAYYLTGRSYDLYAAAADVWDRKASQAGAAAFSWSTDNMRVDKGKLSDEYRRQAQYYRGLSGPTAISLERSDT